MPLPTPPGTPSVDFDRCRVLVLRYLRRRFGNISMDDLHDAVGEALLLYLRSAPPEVRSCPKRTLGWLRSVARRRLWRTLKGRGRAAACRDEAEISGGSLPGTTEGATVERNIAHRSVQALLSRLPPLTAETIFLYAVHDYRPREIAELHSCPVTTVKSRLKRGFRVLRELLSEE